MPFVGLSCHSNPRKSGRVQLFDDRLYIAGGMLGRYRAGCSCHSDDFDFGLKQGKTKSNEGVDVRVDVKNDLSGHSIVSSIIPHVSRKESR